MALQLSITSDDLRYNRRLSDKIVAAFDHACCDGDLQTAGDLLNALEGVITKAPLDDERRKVAINLLVSSHTRLWGLKSVVQPKSNGGSDTDATESDATLTRFDVAV